MTSSMMKLINQIDKSIIELHLAIRKRRINATKTAYVKLKDLTNSLKSKLPTEFVEMNFTDFDRHLHFVDYYFDKRDFDMIKQNFYDIQDNDFPKIKEEIFEYLIEMQVHEKLTNGKKASVLRSKNIFIVHGSDHKPMTELKIMLSEFGLNPIVLHEQPSGSRTVIEKLEKYSDVGYAFVILTPDDRGGSFNGEIPLLGGWKLENSSFRARQNVLLEFGYFIGRIGRDSVCCLLKGHVDRPSDMQGIVYVPFVESLNEVKGKIIKELEEVGYEIK